LERDYHSFQLKLVVVADSVFFIFHYDLRINLFDFVEWFYWNKVAGTEILGDFCIAFYI